MKIICGGVRGSLPVSGQDFVRYGGQTTSFLIQSKLIPSNQALLVDAGTGVRALGHHVIKGGIREIAIVQTHYHDDHLLGLPFSPIVSPEVNCRLEMYGPLCRADGPRGQFRPYGPRQALQQLFRRPRFPVPFSQYEQRLTTTAIVDPLEQGWGTASAWALVFHPRAGRVMVPVADIAKTVEFPTGPPVAINDCLVVTFLYNHHPQRALSLRFEERPTGAVAVIMTDHENTNNISKEMERHLRGAYLLLADCQYSEEQYPHCVGYGHASPHYWVEVARECRLNWIGFIHHDPDSNDQQVEGNVRAARLQARTTKAKNLNIFAGYDGQSLVVKAR